MRNKAETSEATRCPLCGASNHCAVLEGRPVTDCWCSGGRFPKALLEELPANRPRNACICQSCVDRYRLGLDV